MSQICFDTIDTYTGLLWLHQLSWYRVSESLGLYTIEERRGYFLAIPTFQSLHGIAPAYLYNQIVMNFDINGYNTRGADGVKIYVPKIKEIHLQEYFLYYGGLVLSILSRSWHKPKLSDNKSTENISLLFCYFRKSKLTLWYPCHKKKCHYFCTRV